MTNDESVAGLLAPNAAATARALWHRLEQSVLRVFDVGGKRLLPIVQGGMGVGVSAHRLAGTVASMGAMGTIASVDLRHHHADLAERTHLLPLGPATKETIDAANLEALRREIFAAKALAEVRDDQLSQSDQGLKEMVAAVIDGVAAGTKVLPKDQRQLAWTEGASGDGATPMMKRANDALKVADALLAAAPQ